MADYETLQAGTRPLKPAERRLVSARARSLRSHGPHPTRVLGLAALVFVALWLLTLLASDAPWWVVSLFWLVSGAAIALWAWRDTRTAAGQMGLIAEQLESALQQDQADVYDIRARGYVELEEVEDEGACYAFDLGDGRLVFVVGQEFYPDARFPSLDFSLVYPLDAGGARVDSWIEKRGPREEPTRVIPARVKWRLEVPEHLSVVRASPDRLEEALSS